MAELFSSRYCSAECDKPKTFSGASCTIKGDPIYGDNNVGFYYPGNQVTIVKAKAGSVRWTQSSLDPIVPDVDSLTSIVTVYGLVGGDEATITVSDLSGAPLASATTANGVATVPFKMPKATPLGNGLFICRYVQYQIGSMVGYSQNYPIVLDTGHVDVCMSVGKN
jgi:hypothetical protein